MDRDAPIQSGPPDLRPATLESDRNEIMRGWEALFKKLPKFKNFQVINVSLTGDETILEVTTTKAFMRIVALPPSDANVPLAADFSLEGYGSKDNFPNNPLFPPLEGTKEEVEKKIETHFDISLNITP